MQDALGEDQVDGMPRERQGVMSACRKPRPDPRSAKRLRATSTACRTRRRRGSAAAVEHAARTMPSADMPAPQPASSRIGSRPCSASQPARAESPYRSTSQSRMRASDARRRSVSRCAHLKPKASPVWACAARDEHLALAQEPAVARRSASPRARSARPPSAGRGAEQRARTTRRGPRESARRSRGARRRRRRNRPALMRLCSGMAIVLRSQSRAPGQSCRQSRRSR